MPAPPATPAPPVPGPLRELRIGLVLYGGVSLAVYMFGIVREFWHLLRASRGEEFNAYTGALKLANVTATVDVISGTSAGGINGILLAKALATGADLAAISQFWIDRADFDKLLQPPTEPMPRSLLRSDFFEEQLAEAFRTMDRTASGRRLIEVLDLFVSGTRLRGMVREFTDSLGQTVQTRDYRKLFQLRFRTKGYNPADPSLGYDHSDFGPASNAALVEVARATSAFPAAFEPDLIRKRADNAALFRPGEPEAAYFSDGGILHNKPFTETLETIFARQSDRPVRRWLFSVEPDPERYASQDEPGPEPEVLEVLFKAASGIPMYQSIAGDLERLETHNARVRAFAGQLFKIERVITEKFQRIVNEGTTEQFRAFLEQQVLYYAYQALKVDAVISAVTERIVRTAPLPADQREFVEDGVRAHARSAGDAQFLHTFDDGFRLRRAYYLIATLDEFSTTLIPEQRDLFKAARAALWTRLEGIRSLGRRVFEQEEQTAQAIRGLRGQGGDALSAAVQRTLALVGAAMEDGLQRLRMDTLAACQEIEDAIARLKAQGVASSRFPPHPFPAIFDRYEIRDMFILPLDLLADLGERQEVRFIRISPQAALYVRKPPEDKLSGDVLGHFGGFLSRRWRANDILWGRLDASEVIMRVLLEGQAPQVVERHIRAVQDAVCREELSGLWQPATHPDYRTFLEREYKIGAETVADLPAEAKVPLALRAGWVFRNMLRRLGDVGAPGPLRPLFGYTGRGLGIALGFIQWPAIAIWGRDSAVRKLVTLALVFFFGWAVLTFVAGAFGIIARTGTLLLWEGLLALPFVLWVLLLNRRWGVLLIVAIIAGLIGFGWRALAEWLRSSLI
ncbi:MAG: patatin-like protein [Armatimonadota bacterium]|nr:patatin-like protein [Armatimonadota bacterium]